jgi:hypothetical protein
LSAAVVVLGAQGTPRQYLNDAKQALDAISPSGLSQDAAKALTDLKRDFAELQTAFQDSIGATSAAPTRQPLTADWHRKYATVQTDLILADSPSSPAHAKFDEFRSRLEKFNTAAIDQAVTKATPSLQTMPIPVVTPQATCPPVAPSVSRDAVSLLDRMQTIVDDALAGRIPKDQAVATNGSKVLREAGKVSIDRAALDEMRAEIAHLKITLQEASAK